MSSVGSRRRSHAVVSATLLIAAALLFGLGLAIRLTSIRASLWLDEFSTLWAIESTFRDMLRRVPAVMGQSPFYYSLAWLAVHVFGESETTLRLPSLLSSLGAALGLLYAGIRLRGLRAGVAAALVFWLSYPAAWESLDARPYALAMCAAALVIAGFVGAVRGGGRLDRALFVLGGAGLFWAHYVFAPMLVALVIAYVMMPSLRVSYPPRAAAIDAALLVVMALPAAAQAWGVLGNPGSQAWLFRPSPWSTLGVIAPFALAAWMRASRRSADTTATACRRALGFMVGAQFGAVALAWFGGVDLVEARYVSATIAPAALLAGDTLARLSLADAVVPLAVYTIVTGLTYAANRQVYGSWTGAGFQGWREAVSALRADRPPAPSAIVLYRSGNAEDDLGVPGALSWPATLAPLRSPGQVMPAWNIAGLTYRWQSAARERYFDTELRARVDRASTIYVLCLRSSEPGANGYCGAVETWIATTWPGQFRSRPLGSFPSLVVLRLDSSAGGMAAPPPSGGQPDATNGR